MICIILYKLTNFTHIYKLDSMKIWKAQRQNCSRTEGFFWIDQPWELGNLVKFAASNSEAQVMIEKTKSD